MNWVAPIKDDTTLEKFKQKLREVDDKYYILFEIGVGTGLQLQEILKFRNKDIRDKDYNSVCSSRPVRRIRHTGICHISYRHIRHLSSLRCPIAGRGPNDNRM